MNKSELGCLAAVIAVGGTIVAILAYVIYRVDNASTQAYIAAKADPANQVDVNVERIFYHQPKEFTFVTLENDELTFHHWEGCEITWKQDAQAGEPIRVEGNKIERTFTVHLHGVEEIDGSNWDRRHGKYLIEGNTSVVE
jgi:hypothetical protein